MQGSPGYTLVEILIVLGIVALLAAVVGPRVLGYFGKAKTDTAKVQISNIIGAVELYYLDIGRYPPPEVGLAALLTRPSGVDNWNGPYLRRASGIIDPWDRPYVYRLPGESGDFDIFSLGRDNAEGGEGEDADIKSW